MTVPFRGAKRAILNSLIMRKLTLFGAIALLTSGAAVLAQDIARAPTEAWIIGPIIRGKNYSVGMPLHPTPARAGWSFEFPYPDVRAGHVHYVTTGSGSLAGKSRIVMRYRIDGARGVRFVPREYPQFPATVSLFFQRSGDSWSAKRHEHHRWWSPDASMKELAPGEYEMRVSLSDPNWVPVMSGNAAGNPQAFRDALLNAERVGLVFGSNGGRGHGVYATAPARFTLLSYRVE